MRYRLRTLVALTAVGPPLLAGLYWGAKWVGGEPIVFGVGMLLLILAAFVVGLIGCYCELMYMVSGPRAAQTWKRKRRRVRVRIERYEYGST
jgi:hypothetical protein